MRELHGVGVGVGADVGVVWAAEEKGVDGGVCVDGGGCGWREDREVSGGVVSWWIRGYVDGWVD